MAEPIASSLQVTAGYCTRWPFPVTVSFIRERIAMGRKAAKVHAAVTSSLIRPEASLHQTGSRPNRGGAGLGSTLERAKAAKAFVEAVSFALKGFSASRILACCGHKDCHHEYPLLYSSSSGQPFPV